MMSYKPRCCNKDVSSDRSSLDVRNASVIPDLLDSIRKATTERRMNVANVIMLPFINSQFPVEEAA